MTMGPSVPDSEQILGAAMAAAQSGAFARSDALLMTLLQRDPQNGRARYALGVNAFRQGQLDSARSHLEVAARNLPGDPTASMALAIVLRRLGDEAAEVDALERAITADPYFVPAMLARAELFERAGRKRTAAATYAGALKVLPDERQWPAELRPGLLRARQVVAENGREMAAFIADRTGTPLASLTPPEAERWREAGAILSGQSQPYLSNCNRLHVPRLPAVPFFERSQFEWVEQLEACTADVLAEAEALLKDPGAAFSPYVAYPAGAPVNQWGELNHSTRWSSYFLWKNGDPQPDAQARCPLTTRALQAVDMATIGGLCPNVMFSRLAPRTRIPPHHGETNARVVVHLPLIIPDGCRYRVGFEWRKWMVGEVLIFDDTIEHEAINDSELDRLVLIFDAWNPYLSAAERDMVRAVSAAAREFHQEA